eukprot:gene29988-29043_t
MGVLGEHGLLAASLRSVGTAMTMAAVGWALFRWRVVPQEAAAALAAISMNVAIPALLFTSPCDSITDAMRAGWPLLFLPALNVAAGALLGAGICAAARTPAPLRPGVIAAVAFGNSTGMPITLFAAIRSSFPPDTELGKVNPVFFLSMGEGMDGEMGSACTSPEGDGCVGEEAVPERREEPGAGGEAVLLPPAVATMVALLIAVTPLRGWFVDMKRRDNDAPLEWWFNAMLKIGAAAVPLNMIILGGALSNGVEWRRVPWATNLCVAVAKMVVMPLFGVATALSLRRLLAAGPDVDAVSRCGV